MTSDNAKFPRSKKSRSMQISATENNSSITKERVGGEELP